MSEQSPAGQFDTAAIKRACDIVGSQSKLARATGASPALVSLWMLGERQVGWKHAHRIEISTRGKVTCRDLRPDIYEDDRAPGSPGAAAVANG